MEKRNAQAILDEIWPRVKRKHLYPEIPIPRIKPTPDPEKDGMGENDGVGLEMKEKQLTINGSFLSGLKDRMTEERAIEALLDHGISHYTFCPWDFHTHMMLYAEAKKVTGDKALAKQTADYFIDVVADTHCVKKQFSEIPELHRSLKKGKVEEVLASLCQRIWGMDLLGARGKTDDKHDGIVRRLARIPYLDRSRWPESIRKFARSLKPLLLEEQNGEGSPGGTQGDSNPTGGHDLNSYSPEEIDQGLRDYARETMTLPAFRELVEDFSEELKETGYGSEGGMGRGKGVSIDADVLFYMKLAENYAVPVRKLLLERRGVLHPHSHSPWEVGGPIQDVDIWTSFGKFMPGITQTWKRMEGRGKGKIEGIPDCLIAIDSSGSMTNPRKSLSYAVLGAACAVDAYLRNHAKVAVYNFSDAPMGGREVLDYTDRRQNLYRVLCKYFGGGTALDLDDMIPLIQRRKNPDLFIITDMKITNLEAMIGYFGQLPNRITAVHIGENLYADRFRKAVRKRGNITIYAVKKKEDIPNIVLGKIREYFSTTRKEP